MNSYKGRVVEVITEGQISLVKVALDRGQNIHALVIDTVESANYLSPGNEVNVLMKETEVVLAGKTLNDTSIENAFPCTVKSVVKSKVLSKVIVQTSFGDITIVISTLALDRLGLTPGLELLAGVKINEVILST